MHAIGRAVLGCSVVVAGTLLLFSIAPELQAFLLGRDSLAYHLAGRMFLEGANPYDPEVLRSWQVGLGYPHTAARLYYHYPPAVLVPLSVFAYVRYETALTLWFVCTVLFLSLGAVLLLHAANGGALERANARPAPVAPALLLALLFLPHLDLLFEGQVGAVLYLGVALLIWGIARNKYGTAGVGLSFLFMKPHLVIALLAVVLVCAIRERKTRLLVGSVAIPSVLSLMSEIYWPGIHAAWLTSFATLPPYPRTAALLSFTGSWDIAVGASAIASLGVVVAVLPRVRLATLAVWIPLVATLSILISPRVWVSDLSLLALVPVAAYAALSASSSRTVQFAYCAGWLTLQLMLLLIVLAEDVRFAEQFFWFPLLILPVTLVPIQKKPGTSPGF